MEPISFAVPTLPHQRVLVVTDEGEIDFSSTLASLDGVTPETPLIIEERYLNVQDGVDLLLRLRMTPELPASRCPVIVRLQHPVEWHIRRHGRFAILASEGVALLGPTDQLESVDAPTPIDEPTQLRVLESLPIRIESDGSRHSLANRWGPYRLWAGAQALKPEDEQDSQPPPQVQEAYDRLLDDQPYAHQLALAELRRRVHTAPPPPPSGMAATAWADWTDFLNGYAGDPIQVLLLDDEIDEGWGAAVAALLERPGKLSVDVSLADADFDAENERVVELATGTPWDLVLADLRTSAADRQQAQAQQVDTFGGADLIRRIKGAHPETAVVAFTASNKVWSMHRLRELGAEGYWTKEGPEHGVDDTYSREHAATLLDTAKAVLSRRIVARPVWKLRSDLAALIADPAYVSGWYPGGQPNQAEERLRAVLERIDRTYGFLVSERSTYEQVQYRLRPYDLSFLTLWSALSEVNALVFDGPLQQNNGELADHPNAVFRYRDPVDGQWKIYWHVQNGVVVVPPAMPGGVRRYVCPTKTDGTPLWPGVRAETERVIWILSPNNSPFRGLRTRRNKLEEEHGQINDRQEATVADVHAICEVWRAILVTPYV
ncbi:MAG TPA: hypothetical protein VGB53_10225 [Rubricoccaceae bacterium]|jgi:CheY-like chemotaxis protein